MDREVIDLQAKRLEKNIPQISAKVADALEHLEEAKRLLLRSEIALTVVSQELEELYLASGENEELR